MDNHEPPPPITHPESVRTVKPGRRAPRSEGKVSVGAVAVAFNGRARESQARHRDRFAVLCAVVRHEHLHVFSLAEAEGHDLPDDLLVELAEQRGQA